MIEDKSKTQRQLIGVDKFLLAGRGTLNYVMRFGKTFTGVLIINRFIKQNKKNILILTPSEAVTNIWIKTLNGYNIEAKVLSINAAMNIEHSIYDLVIIDEIHKFTSDKRYEFISEVLQTNSLLGLTGTYPSGLDKAKLDSICPIIDVITEKEALDNKWICPYKEYNIYLKFTPLDEEKYLVYTKAIREILDLFNGCKNLFDSNMFYTDSQVVECCAVGYKSKHGYVKPAVLRTELARRKGWSLELDITKSYDKMISDNWSPMAIEEHAKYYMEIVRLRNQLMIDNPVKLNAVLEIYKRFPNRTILFNESTDFADDISEAINHLYPNTSICYHSNIESKLLLDENNQPVMTKTGKQKVIGKTLLKRIAIEGLTTGKYNVLSTARALDEGLDVPAINQVICTAGTANPMQYKQRSARGKTVDIYNTEKVTTIFNLAFDDVFTEGKIIKSRDKTKLNIRQQGNTSDIIEIKDFDTWLQELDTI